MGRRDARVLAMRLGARSCLQASHDTQATIPSCPTTATTNPHTGPRPPQGKEGHRVRVCPKSREKLPLPRPLDLPTHPSTPITTHPQVKPRTPHRHAALRPPTPPATSGRPGRARLCRTRAVLVFLELQVRPSPPIPPYFHDLPPPHPPPQLSPSHTQPKGEAPRSTCPLPPLPPPSFPRPSIACSPWPRCSCWAPWHPAAPLPWPLVGVAWITQRPKLRTRTSVARISAKKTFRVPLRYVCMCVSIHPPTHPSVRLRERTCRVTHPPTHPPTHPCTPATGQLQRGQAPGRALLQICLDRGRLYGYVSECFFPFLSFLGTSPSSFLIPSHLHPPTHLRQTPNRRGPHRRLVRKRQSAGHEIDRRHCRQHLLDGDIAQGGGHHGRGFLRHPFGPFYPEEVVREGQG